MTLYNFILIAAVALLGGLTNIRIGYFLADKKWKMEDGNGIFMIIVSTVCAVAILIVMALDAIALGGNLYGLFMVALSIPVVGAVWAYVIATIKAIQLILRGLVSKINEA